MILQYRVRPFSAIEWEKQLDEWVSYSMLLMLFSFCESLLFCTDGVLYCTAFGNTIIRERRFALPRLGYETIPPEFALIIFAIAGKLVEKFFNKEQVLLLNSRCDWLIEIKIVTAREPNWPIVRHHMRCLFLWSTGFIHDYWLFSVPVILKTSKTYTMPQFFLFLVQLYAKVNWLHGFHI